MNQIKLDIGGQERGFLLGLGFLGDMLIHFDTDIQGLGEIAVNNNIFALAPACVYYGNKHYCMNERQVFDIRFSDVDEWFLKLENGIMGKEVQGLLSMMTKTLTAHMEAINKGAEDDESKKK